MGLYTDDLILITKDKNPNIATAMLQESVNEIATWYRRWKIKINATKTQAIQFTKGRTPPDRNIEIDDTQIPWSNSVKYLGITLDKKLTWKHHGNILKQKVTAQKQKLSTNNKNQTPTLHTIHSPHNTILLSRLELRLLHPLKIHSNPAKLNSKTNRKRPKIRTKQYHSSWLEHPINRPNHHLRNTKNVHERQNPQKPNVPRSNRLQPTYNPQAQTSSYNFHLNHKGKKWPSALPTRKAEKIRTSPKKVFHIRTNR